MTLFFEALPDEIKLRIFGNIKYTDYGKYALVCKDWHRLFTDDLIWKINLANLLLVEPAVLNTLIQSDANNNINWKRIYFNEERFLADELPKLFDELHAIATRVEGVYINLHAFVQTFIALQERTQFFLGVFNHFVNYLHQHPQLISFRLRPFDWFCIIPYEPGVKIWLSRKIDVHEKVSYLDVQPLYLVITFCNWYTANQGEQAAFNKYKPIVQALLDSGADVHLPEEFNLLSAFEIAKAGKSLVKNCGAKNTLLIDFLTTYELACSTAKKPRLS